MTDRVLIRASAAGAILAAICCATPLLAVVLPRAGLGAGLARADVVPLALLVAGLGLLAGGLHRRRVKAACCELEIHKEGVKP